MTAAKVDRMTAANMTALQVHQKLMRALQDDRLTAEVSHELDYAQDLMEALDEELAHYRVIATSVVVTPRHQGAEGDSAMSNFTTGRLVLVTEPDKQGVHMIAVEWCRTCYAMVPEDFMGDHVQQSHSEGESDS